MTEVDLLELGTDGPSAPPRSNGELVFDAPWQSRAFAMAVSLAGEGFFTLDEFREHLIASISKWESESDGDEPFEYYRCWERALESLAVAKELVGASRLDQRAQEYAARPPGHDHDHDHDHDHHH